MTLLITDTRFSCQDAVAPTRKGDFLMLQPLINQYHQDTTSKKQCGKYKKALDLCSPQGD